MKFFINLVLYLSLIGAIQAQPVDSTRSVMKNVLPNEESISTEKLLPQSQQRLALVIGNAKYKFKPLRNPVNDANLMESTLHDLNFDVVKRTNCTLNELIQAIKEFGKKLTPNTVAFVFYAGHGVEAHGKNYLIPIDAILKKEADTEKECVALETIVQQLQTAKTQNNLLVLDACRDNPFTKTWEGGAIRTIGKVNPKEGLIVFYATHPGTTASDGKGKNGLFTSYLVQNLNRSCSTLSDIMTTTTDEVEQASENHQTPFVEGKMFAFEFKPCDKDTNAVQNEVRKTEKVTRAHQNMDKILQVAKKNKTLAVRMLLYQTKHHVEDEMGHKYLYEMLMDAQHLLATQQLKGHEKEISCMALSLDEKWLVTGGSDEKAILWNLETQTIEKTFPEPEGIWRLAFSHDGKKLLIVTNSTLNSHKLSIWNIATQSCEQILKVDAGLPKVVNFSQDGQKVFVLFKDKKILRWDLTTQTKEVLSLKDALPKFSKFPEFEDAIFSPDCKYAAFEFKNYSTMPIQYTTILWNIQKSKAEKTFTNVSFEGIAFSADSKKLWLGTTEKTILLWDVTQRIVENTAPPKSGLSAFKFSADGKSMYGVRGDEFMVWDANTQNLQKMVRVSPPSSLPKVVFSPTRQTFYSVNAEETRIDVYPLYAPQAAHISLMARSFVFSADNKTLLTSHPEVNPEYNKVAVTIWDFPSFNIKAQFKGHNSWTNSAVFSPDEKKVLTGSTDKTVALWDIATGKEEKRFNVSYDVGMVQFSPDGKKILIGTNDIFTNLTLWDMETANLEHTFASESMNPIYSFAFSPDSKKIVIGYKKGEVALYDLGNLQQQITFTNRVATALAFSPNGEKIFIGTREGSLWDVAAKKMEKKFVGHQKVIRNVCFSADGKRILTSGYDRTTRLWDIDRQKVEKIFISPAGDARDIGFWKNGEYIWNGYTSGDFKIWHATDHCIESVICPYSLAELSDYGLQLEPEDLLILWEQGEKLSAAELKLIGKLKNK